MTKPYYREVCVTNVTKTEAAERGEKIILYKIDKGLFVYTFKSKEVHFIEYVSNKRAPKVHHTLI